jgi:FlaA1/EpsC-like NDP-sugar epimerase
LLRACAEQRVPRFILISTDKAVNPTSVMGASKRVAELLVQSAAQMTGLAYASVRFGNVLSSRGSVVPIFREQLARGGPLLVTDPEVSRFFMTIPEAVQLVLQAAAFAQPADTFILDMGEPVKIADLATDLVELHGLEAGRDVDIQFIGLRPGEKLTEELTFADEQLEPTDHEAILRVRHALSRRPLDDGRLTGLRAAASDLDRVSIVRSLCELVPEYRPSALYAPS